MQVLLLDGALDTGRIPEGNIVSFMCEADANPSELTYRWFLNDEVMPEQNSKIMVICENATVKYLIKKKLSRFSFLTQRIYLM